MNAEVDESQAFHDPDSTPDHSDYITEDDRNEAKLSIIKKSTARRF